MVSPERTTTLRISIHALHEESDKINRMIVTSQEISIHALHEESDPDTACVRSPTRYFNPRSP